MNNVKILCIAGSIVLGSILLSGQAFGKAPSDLITLSAPKEPEGQHVSYEMVPALIMTVSQIQLTILSRGLSLLILIIPKPFH